MGRFPGGSGFSTSLDRGEHLRLVAQLSIWRRFRLCRRSIQGIAQLDRAGLDATGFDSTETVGAIPDAN
jgi:hypothetical protein